MTRRQALFAALSSFAALMLSPLRRVDGYPRLSDAKLNALAAGFDAKGWDESADADKAADEPDSTVLYVFSTRWNDGKELGRGFYRAQPVKLASATDPTQAANAKFVPAGKPVLALNLLEMDQLRWRYVDVTTAGRYVYANRIGEGRYAFSHIDAKPVSNV